MKNNYITQIYKHNGHDLELVKRVGDIIYFSGPLDKSVIITDTTYRILSILSLSEGADKKIELVIKDE